MKEEKTRSTQELGRKTEKTQAHRQKEFNRWWNEIGEKRREEYLKLEVLDGDQKELPSRIMECKNLLNICEKLTGVKPVGLKFEGTTPTLVVQIGSDSTNQGEIVEKVGKNTIKYFEANFDTTEFGIETFSPKIEAKTISMGRIRLPTCASTYLNPLIKRNTVITPETAKTKIQNQPFIFDGGGRDSLKKNAPIPQTIIVTN